MRTFRTIRTIQTSRIPCNSVRGRNGILHRSTVTWVASQHTEKYARHFSGQFFDLPGKRKKQNAAIKEIQLTQTAFPPAVIPFCKTEYP